jgi:hypothetical protein
MDDSGVAVLFGYQARLSKVGFNLYKRNQVLASLDWYITCIRSSFSFTNDLGHSFQQKKINTASAITMLLSTRNSPLIDRLTAIGVGRRNDQFDIRPRYVYVCLVSMVGNSLGIMVRQIQEIIKTVGVAVFSIQRPLLTPRPLLGVEVLCIL